MMNQEIKLLNSFWILRKVNGHSISWFIISLGSPHLSSPYTLPFGAAGGVRRDEGSGEPPFGARKERAK